MRGKMMGGNQFEEEEEGRRDERGEKKVHGD